MQSYLKHMDPVVFFVMHAGTHAGASFTHSFCAQTHHIPLIICIGAIILYHVENALASFRVAAFQIHSLIIFTDTKHGQGCAKACGSR